MKDKILSLSSFRNTVVLLRHADRDKIPSGEFGNDVLLNENGKENAFLFGERIKDIPVAKILSSPIERCIQTAEFVSQGYGRELPIQRSNILGDPGMHIIDSELAGKYYLEHGIFPMYEKFMAGDKVPGMPVVTDFRRNFSQFLDEESDENGLTLMVSHDFFIAVAEFALYQKKYTVDNWVHYLDGFIAKRM